MKHKKLFITFTAIFSLIIFLAIFLLVWFFGDSYEDFASFRQEFEIPGLDEGAVPQGMGNCSATYETEGDDGETVTASQQYFFITAYMVDGSPSRLYVTGADTGYVGYVTMKNTDGSYYSGHCGGVATNGTFLWVTGEGTVYVAKASEAYANVAAEIIDKAAKNASGDYAEEKLSVAFTASFDANCEASFCYYFDDPRYTSVSYDRLYVGEFYRKGNYETDENHRFTTLSGYENTAFMYEYKVSTSGDYGLQLITDADVENFVPKIQTIYSLPEKIQGVAWSGRTGYNSSDGILVLSQSYGLANSRLLCYDWGKVISTSNYQKYLTLSGESFKYAGVKKKSGADYTVTDLKVYFVDSGDENIMVNDYSIPSMSEGLCTVGNRVFVLFESAGKKYRTFVREKLDNVYSFIPRAV